MRILHACAYVALTAFAVACGGGSDAKPDAPPIVIPDAPMPDAFVPPMPDAQQFDFTCLGNSAPTTAPATVAISGSVNDINTSMMIVPVADAAVKAFKNGSPDLQIGSTTSDSAGAWSLPAVPTGTIPVDGYVEAKKATHRTVRLYPPSPISEDIPNAPVLLISDSTFSLLVQFTGNTQSDANGTVGLAVVDCANTPIGGATVTVKQNGADVGTIFDASQLQDGAFLVFDVPPGDTVVSASFMGMTFRAHNVTTLAKTTSTTIVKPGF